jgi:Arc/MetJ-type ribon-helix-helix transcriptional regulator
MDMTNRPRIENEARINVRVKGPMAEHLHAVIGPMGMYENQSEYIRDLIRHDMAHAAAAYNLETSLRKGYAQLAAGEYNDQPFDDIIAGVKEEWQANQNG